ncbi:hypothetical protein F4781DRAFT_420229 [Annulohypoxylon bovei var. microspora]|nr:hypothetical protein F4781DRAFT_420229 [Annulohypoxylon bovei var. microspora]
MRINVHFRTTGPNLNTRVNLDVPHNTTEDEGHDGIINDRSSLGYGVKIESPSPSASPGRYDAAVDRSSISSERYASGTERSGTSASDRDSNLSPLPSKSLNVPLKDQKDLVQAVQDGYHSKKSTARTAARLPELARGDKNPTRHHLLPEVWERHKEEIHELYIEQNKSLNELMEFMEEKGIEATPRMYKAKFRQWGFVKNNKQKDVAMMLRLQRERGAVGKITTFRRHGRSVDIETYMKRKGVSSFDLVTPVVNANLPDYLRVLTPPPAEPQHMTLPSHLHAQEVIVSCFKDLALSWHDSMAAPASFENDFNMYFDGELCEATRDFSRACWFFSRNHISHGALLSQRAFSSLHLIFRTPSALGLFDLLIASVISPDYGLAKELWRYLAGYAEAILGSSSTLCRVFTALDEVFRNNTLGIGVDFIFSCMESIIGMLLETSDFAQTVAPSISFFLLGDLILFNSTRTNLPSLQRAVASASMSSQGGQPSPGVMRFIEPAAYLWQNGPYDEYSAQLAYSSVRIIDKVPNRYDWDWVSWRVIAQFHRSRCDSNGSAVKDHPRHALARYALERAIDAAEVGRGFSESQIFENMLTLEAWHREAGDMAQELAIRQRREKGLHDYFQALQHDRETDILET